MLQRFPVCDQLSAPPWGKTPPQTHAFLQLGFTSLLHEGTLCNAGHISWGHGRPKRKAKVCFHLRPSHKEFCWTPRLLCVFVPRQQGHSGFHFLEKRKHTCGWGSSGAQRSHFIFNFNVSSVKNTNSCCDIISWSPHFMSKWEIPAGLQAPTHFFFTCATWLSTNVRRKVHVLYRWCNNCSKIKYESVEML